MAEGILIIAILGDVGSGKTLSAVKLMKERGNFTFTNIETKLKNTQRILRENIIKKDKNSVAVNWDFWQEQVDKYKGFDIVLDEIHNIAHSRRAMSKENTLLTIWLSQIRKILGESKRCHIILISQRIMRIDTAFRDMLDTIIFCEKVPTSRGFVIKQYLFMGDAVDKYTLWVNNRREAKRQRVYRIFTFKAENYFKYYDSYALVKFGENEYI